MVVLVVDPSVAAAWCFQEEATEYTEAVLTAVSGTHEALAPRLWAYELRNTVLMGVSTPAHHHNGRQRVSSIASRLAHLAHGPGVV